MTDEQLFKLWRAANEEGFEVWKHEFSDMLRPDAKPCTCHPDDNPPVPCAKQYALSECRSVADKEQK